MRCVYKMKAKVRTVERGVEVSLARRAFSGIADDARVFAPRRPLQCVRCSGGLRELSAERRGDGVEVVLAGPVVYGHLAT